MRVETSQSLTLNSLVNATGILSTIDGERRLISAVIEDTGATADVRPFALRTSALGGGTFGLQPAVQEYRAGQLLSAVGINNIGLLIKICGRVTYVGDDFFYLDDGAACDDGSGHSGVRVYCGNLTTPSQESFVAVTGISSTYTDSSRLYRLFVVRRQEDIQPIR